MIVSDIFVSDSGRAIRNTGAIVTYVTNIGSGSIVRRANDPVIVGGGNTTMYPSGSYGVTTLNPNYNRFDDNGYYTTAHSGYFYGGSTIRDIRQ